MKVRIIRVGKEYRLQEQVYLFPFRFGPRNWEYFMNLSGGIWSSESYAEALEELQRHKGDLIKEVVYEDTF